MDRLAAVIEALDNDVQKLVIDLSCRKSGETWTVAMNKWQTLTEMEVNHGKGTHQVPTLLKVMLTQDGQRRSRRSNPTARSS